MKMFRMRRTIRLVQRLLPQFPAIEVSETATNERPSAQCKHSDGQHWVALLDFMFCVEFQTCGKGIADMQSRVRLRTIRISGKDRSNDRVMFVKEVGWPGFND
jgi:hypothetical protein